MKDENGVVELHQGSKTISTAHIAQMLWKEPLRVLRHGRDAFIVFVGYWGTGQAREFVLVRRNPLVLKWVGSYENAAIAGFERHGTIRSYPRHWQQIENVKSTKSNWHDWMRYTWRWDPKRARFVQVAKKQVHKMEPEAWRFFRGS